MKIKPRADWLLIVPEKPQDKVSEFGIVSPDNVEKEKKAIGEVLEVGPDVEGLKKGDKVVYGVYCGEDVTIKEKGKEVEYKLLKGEDCLATIEK